MMADPNEKSMSDGDDPIGMVDGVLTTPGDSEFESLCDEFEALAKQEGTE